MFGVWAMPLAIFWICFMLVVNIRNRRKWLSMAYGLLMLGALLNGLVLLANRGHMPVLRPHMYIGASDKVHSEFTPESHLKALCDVHGPEKARYSLGDIFCVASLLPFLICVFTKERRS